MRVLTILSGFLMLLTGAFCLINPGQTFLSIAFVIGVVMVLNGVIHALAYLYGRGLHNKGDNNGWILIDALLTLLLGILVLCNQLVADTSIPMVFGIWVLVSGLLRIEAASRIDKKRKPKNFKWTLWTGIITLIVGVLGFVNPLVAWVTTVTLLGLFFVMQGVNIIELGVNMPHTKQKGVKKFKRSRGVVIIDDEIHETPEAVAERLAKQEEEAIEAKKLESHMEVIGAVVPEKPAEEPKPAAEPAKPEKPAEEPKPAAEPEKSAKTGSHEVASKGEAVANEKK